MTTLAEAPSLLPATPLGARLHDDGASFALWAPRASRVELVLVAEDGGQTSLEGHPHPDGVWTHLAPRVRAGQRYGYRVHGRRAPERGLRFDPTTLLLDPYARAITDQVDPGARAIPDQVDPGARAIPDQVDPTPLAVVVADFPPPPTVPRPVPLAETVLYELHVRGFTRQHPAVPPHQRGTYAGLAHPAVVDYLRSLGVTAVELLPVHAFVSEPFLTRHGRANYWGYNSIGFFAPHGPYAAAGTLGGQVREFQAMVATLHAAGLEVILDVVYNHTGEGDQEGPTLAFRGLEHAGYYRLSPDLRRQVDLTGCGNSLDTSHPAVLGLVLDSLRYWVQVMGVDGFRFDLATTLVRDGKHHPDPDHPFLAAVASDPVLHSVKIIVEPWDVGPDGYRLGGFDPATEWNDQFRGHVRDFWRGRTAGVAELAARMAGSPDVFAADARPPTASLNYITAHDGFTLRDLLTYQTKRNTDNGEGNADGSADNRGWNCGVEGETADPTVNALRRRQAANLMATMLLAAGVPMLTAGDERGRTQGGNNNAYCQDSPVSWLDWAGPAWDDLAEFTGRLLRLRAEHPVLRPAEYRHGQEICDPVGRPTGRKNLAWFSGRGPEMTLADWSEGDRRTLGMYIADDAPDRETDDAFLVWLHAGPDPIEVRLPGPPWAETYTVVAATGPAGEFGEDKMRAEATVRLPARTVAVLQVD